MHNSRRVIIDWMPVALQGPITVTDPEPVHYKLWTREECGFLVRNGVIDPRKYELTEGELVQKVRSHFHIRALMMACRWLNGIFAVGRVLQEPSIQLTEADTAYNDPEPDAVVLRAPYDDFSGKAHPEDIQLVIEVSDSTLATDTTIKAALYCRAGLPDYWVLDIKGRRIMGRRIIEHREPLEGAYRSITIYAEDEPVTPLAAPNASIRAADLL